MKPRSVEEILEDAAIALAWRGNHHGPNYDDPLVREIHETLDELRHQQALSLLRSAAGQTVPQPQQRRGLRPVDLHAPEPS